tara:strand:- start:58 stop:1296 length:1239 start_codon:yes stop_codon:yes gene_type:complete
MILRLGLLFLFIIGVHSRLRLFSGEDLLLPFVIAFFIGLIFAVLHFPKYLNKRFNTIALLILFFFGSVFWGPNAQDPLIFKEKLLAFIQIFTSIIFSYAIFWELKKYDKIFLSKFFLFVLIFFLFGALLEIITPLKFLMEDLMRPLYPPNAFYYSYLETINRDSSYYLFYRPKFLTSEPSYVGETVSLLIIFWRLSTNHSQKNFIYILLFFISFLIVRSPVIFTLIPIYFIINYLYESNRKKIIVSFTNFLLFILLSIFSLSIMQERIDQASYGLDNSLTMRIIAPLLITNEVLNQHPFFGVGIEAKEATENIILEKFYSLGLSSYLEGNNISLDILVDKNHSFTLKFLIYFGFFGLGIIIFLLRKILIQHSVKNSLFIFLIFFILGFTQGNVTGINTWTYFFIISRLSIQE